MDFTNFFFGKKGEDIYGVGNSLRFRGGVSASAPHLVQPAGYICPDTFTYSFWFKLPLRPEPSYSYAYFLNQNNNGGSGTGPNLWISVGDASTTPGTLTYYTDAGSATNINGNPVQRDPSAWYHCVMSSGPDGNNVAINGKEFGFSSDVGQFSSTTGPFSIGHGFSETPYDPSDMYLSEAYFIDGKVLSPSVFGEYDDQGNWLPRDPEFAVNAYKYSAQVTADPDFYAGAGPELMFDGQTATITQASTEDGTLTFKPIVPIEYTSEVVIHSYRNATDQAVLNGGSPVSMAAGGVPGETVIASGSGTIETIVTSGYYGGNVGYIKVDGEILIDGPRYSDNFTSSSGFASGFPATQAFDGNPSTYASAEGTGTLTFAPTTPLKVRDRVEVYNNAGNLEYTFGSVVDRNINQQATWNLVYDASVDGGETEISAANPLEIAMGSPATGNTAINGIRVDGADLVDGAGLDYGAKGWYLKFTDPNNPGKDYSGNGLDFTAVNMTPEDVVLDSPTDNYATGNPVFGSSSTYNARNMLDGAVQIAEGAQGLTIGRKEPGETIYFELETGYVSNAGTWGGWWNQIQLVDGPQYDLNSTGSSGQSPADYLIGRGFAFDISSNVYANNVDESEVIDSPFSANDCIGVKISDTNITIYVNGVESSGVNDLAFASDFGNGMYLYAIGAAGRGNTTEQMKLNFGQFGFKYQPSGTKALRVQSLPKSSVPVSSDHFRAITGAGEGYVIYLDSNSGDPDPQAAANLTDPKGSTPTAGFNATSVIFDMGAPVTAASPGFQTSGGYWATDGPGYQPITTLVSLDGSANSWTQVDQGTYTDQSCDDYINIKTTDPFRYVRMRKGTTNNFLGLATGIMRGNVWSEPTVTAADTSVPIALGEKIGSWNNQSKYANNIPTYTVVLDEPIDSIQFRVENGWAATVVVYYSEDGTTWRQDTDQVPPGNSWNAGVQYTYDDGTPIKYMRVLATNSAGYNFGFVDNTVGDANGILDNVKSVFPNALWWIKDMATNNQHQLIDSVRGGDLALQSPASGAETPYVVPASESVAWCWKAGGAPVGNSDGSILSQVSANTAGGFSIVTYSGNATAGATVGHGLGSTPEFIIVKGRNFTDEWHVKHKDMTNPANSLRLNTGGGEVDFNAWNGVDPDASVFTLGPVDGTNKSGAPMVAYCWTGVPGYSEFGHYIGNSTVDNCFVYTGFKPAWLMIKSLSTGSNWHIYDTSRCPENPSSRWLYADGIASETTGFDVDMNANGFKIRSSNGPNGQTKVVYAAFAEKPFESGVTAR